MILSKITGLSACALATLVCAGDAIATPQVRQLTPLMTNAGSPSGSIANDVCLGNNGTQISLSVGFGTPENKLYSTFQRGVTAPLCVDESPGYALHSVTSAAKNSSLRTSLMHSTATTQSPAQAVVRTYGASAVEPLWTYTYPFEVSSTFDGAQVSTNGERVVSWALNVNLDTVHINVFDDATGVPTNSYQFNSSYPAKAAVMSDDGSMLMFTTLHRVYFIDLDTGSTTQSPLMLTNLSNLTAATSDGTRFLQTTGIRTVYVFGDGTGQLGLQSEHTIEMPWSIDSVAISEDGSRMAVAYFDYVNYRNLRVQVLDISSSTHTVLMDETYFGTGNSSVRASQIHMGADGSRVAFSNWSDESGTIPELIVYGEDASGLWSTVAEADLPGSVLYMDFDGNHIAVASKFYHATYFQGGYRLDLFRLDRPSVEIIGTPRAGEDLLVRLNSNRSVPGLLFSADTLAGTPQNYGNVGTLYLQRNGLNVEQRQAPNANGDVEFTITLPTTPGTVGSTRFAQGLLMGPRELSTEFATITVLP